MAARNSRFCALIWAVAAVFCAESGPAMAWQPDQPITFVIPAGKGGGADQMAHEIAKIVAKQNLAGQPLNIANEAGGAGAQGFLDVKGDRGNPNKIIITLSNLFTTPLATGVPFDWTEFTPVAVGQVSDGSKAQLGALEQSATALEQSAEAITEVAKSTERASEQARHAASLVSSGIAQMDEMVQVVLAISQNSTQIRRIADAISHIAAQTNMLSLNAAIEAARAGEHGKGFSVVAEEVRKLAENAGRLAREIADQVRQSTEEAERGVAMVRQVSESMQALAGGVRESDNLTNSIAGAMSEQQAIVADINRNVAKLTRIGQANAAAAEEITATMIDLSTLAETTRVAVDDFNTLGVWGGQKHQAPKRPVA
jgi:hypothetical protein